MRARGVCVCVVYRVSAGALSSASLLLPHQCELPGKLVSHNSNMENPPCGQYVTFPVQFKYVIYIYTDWFQTHRPQRLV